MGLIHKDVPRFSGAIASVEAGRGNRARCRGFFAAGIVDLLSRKTFPNEASRPSIAQLNPARPGLVKPASLPSLAAGLLPEGMALLANDPELKPRTR